MCGFQVSLLSRWSPKYRICSTGVSGVSRKDTVGQEGKGLRRRVKVIWWDLSGFILILQFLHHSSIDVMCICSVCDALVGSLYTDPFKK